VGIATLAFTVMVLWGLRRGAAVERDNARQNKTASRVAGGR